MYYRVKCDASVTQDEIQDVINLVVKGPKSEMFEIEIILLNV